MPKKTTPRTPAEWFEHCRNCFHKTDGMAAVKALERVIDLDPAYCHSDGDNPYFYLGKIQEVEGRIDGAIINYSRALAINPVDEESLIGRGSCYTVTKQHEQAIEDFTKLLQCPDKKRRVPRKHLLYAIGENYSQIEDWCKAIYWARQAHAADPGNERHQQLLKELTEKIKQSTE